MKINFDWKKGIYFLILGILLLFPLGQLTRISLPWPEVHFYWHDFVLLILFFYLLLVSFLRKREVEIPKLLKPILGFTIIALISLGLNNHRFALQEVFIGSLYLGRWLTYAGLYWAIKQLEKEQLKKVSEYLLLAGGVSAVLGLIQFWQFPNAWPLTADQWDPHVSRIIGTFLDPGFTGLIYVLALLLLSSKFWNRTNKFRLPATSYQLAAAVFYLAFILTYSRSAYLAFIVGMGIISWIRKSPRLFFIILLIFAISLTFLPRPHGEGVKLERTSTIEARVVNWQQSWQIFKQKPLEGTGFNLYRYAQRDQGFLKEKWQLSHAGAGADASYLFVLATTGLIGLNVYLWLWAEIIHLAWENRRQVFGLTLLSSSGAVLIHAFFNNSLFYVWVMLWLWLLIGLTEEKI